MSGRTSCCSLLASAKKILPLKGVGSGPVPLASLRVTKISGLRVGDNVHRHCVGLFRRLKEGIR